MADGASYDPLQGVVVGLSMCLIRLYKSCFTLTMSSPCLLCGAPHKSYPKAANLPIRSCVTTQCYAFPLLGKLKPNEYSVTYLIHW